MTRHRTSQSSCGLPLLHSRRAAPDPGLEIDNINRRSIYRSVKLPICPPAPHVMSCHAGPSSVSQRDPPSSSLDAPIPRRICSTFLHLPERLNQPAMPCNVVHMPAYHPRACIALPLQRVCLGRLALYLSHALRSIPDTQSRKMPVAPFAQIGQGPPACRCRRSSQLAFCLTNQELLT